MILFMHNRIAHNILFNLLQSNRNIGKKIKENILSSLINLTFNLFNFGLKSPLLFLICKYLGTLISFLFVQMVLVM